MAEDIHNQKAILKRQLERYFSGQGKFYAEDIEDLQRFVVHNHPSGDPTPSNEDIELTKRLAEAGKILGIATLHTLQLGLVVFLPFASI